MAETGGAGGPSNRMCAAMFVAPNSPCALCRQPIDIRQSFFATSGDFLPPGDPLFPLCDAPFHWSCYSAWTERPRFARAYVDAWVEVNHRNPFWGTAYLDDLVYMSVNPEPAIAEAAVRLCKVGSDIRVPLRKWTRWLSRPEQVTRKLQEVEREALREVLPKLAPALPTAQAVIDAIDWDEKRRPLHRRSRVRRREAR